MEMLSRTVGGTRIAAEPSSRQQAGWAVKQGDVIQFIDQLETKGAPEGWLGFGSYVDGILTKSNWGQLHISTNGNAEDADQLFAAGWLEGWLTAHHIYDHHVNMQSAFNFSSDEVQRWLDKQLMWTRHKASRARRNGDGKGQQQEMPELQEVPPAGAPQAEYAHTALRDGHEAGRSGSQEGGMEQGLWSVVGLLLQQLDGLLAGYNARAEATENAVTQHSGESTQRLLPRLTSTDLLVLSGVGDVDDLQTALEEDEDEVRFAELTPAELAAELAYRGKCSALVKVTGNMSDILMSHSSWFTYSAMVRIYKTYDFPLANPHHVLKRMSFSSYPAPLLVEGRTGELSSDDDFYLLDTGMVVLQTTNSIYNKTLYDLLTSASLTSWQRVRAACAMAKNGKEWTDVVSLHNSGTGNNQWMVVDLKRFAPGKELEAGLLWVAEQIPGLVLAADLTDMLALSYWPSFNVPYFPEIYRRSGYAKMRSDLKGLGPAYEAAVAGLSHQLAPRASLFRRDVGSVTDLASLKAFMRSNNFQQDPYSNGSSLAAICGRGDVNPARPKAYGCYDTKATNYELALRLEAHGVVGPTTGAGALSPFEWQPGSFPTTSHQGQPQKFDFDFEHLFPYPNYGSYFGEELSRQAVGLSH